MADMPLVEEEVVNAGDFEDAFLHSDLSSIPPETIADDSWLIEDIVGDIPSTTLRGCHGMKY